MSDADADAVPWQFRARAEGPGRGPIDGDTLDLQVDLGFYVDRRIRVRLRDVDTDEIHGVSHDSHEYRRGQAQLEFVKAWLGKADADWDGEWPLLVETEQDTGKYGRWVATVRRRTDHMTLSNALIMAFGEELASDYND